MQYDPIKANTSPSPSPPQRPTIALSLSNLSFAPFKPSLGGFGTDLSRRLHLLPSSLDHRLPADPSLSLRHSKKRKSPRRSGDCSAGGVGGFANVITASADYYSTLGVPRSANNKEIKAAYRRLARQIILTFQSGNIGIGMIDLNGSRAATDLSSRIDQLKF